jgi:hypothetical protein
MAGLSTFSRGLIAGFVMALTFVAIFQQISNLRRVDSGAFTTSTTSTADGVGGSGVDLGSLLLQPDPEVRNLKCFSRDLLYQFVLYIRL